MEMMTPTLSHSRNQMSAILTPETTIYVAGHRGMVGAAILRHLRELGYSNLLTRTHSELELTDQKAVRGFFHNEKIDHVILAAARVGGIYANNTYPAEFIYQNLMVQTNVIHEAHVAGVQHLLFLGSSCIYPKFAPQPMKEEHLLTGILEPTNEPYAIAKIAGIKMCESYNRQYGTQYYSVMPTNLYGPGDNYHLENSHVIPAMLRKYHLAKLAKLGDLESIKQDEATYGPIPADIKDAIGLADDSSSLLSGASNARVQLWGSGAPRREFLHVDDMAAACIYVMNLDKSSLAQETEDESRPCSFVNVGSGLDDTIGEVAEMICEVVGFEGETVYDADKPDGTMQKLLDTQKISSLNWKPLYSLKDGLIHAYQWYCNNLS